MSLTDTLEIEMTRERAAEERRKQRDLTVLARRIEHTQRLIASLRSSLADATAFSNELIIQRAALEGHVKPLDVLLDDHHDVTHPPEDWQPPAPIHSDDLPRDAAGQIDHEAFMSRDDSQITADGDGHFDRQGFEQEAT